MTTPSRTRRFRPRPRPLLPGSARRAGRRGHRRSDPGRLAVRRSGGAEASVVEAPAALMPMRSSTRRRTTELLLGVMALVITTFGYVLVQLADAPDLPPDTLGDPRGGIGVVRGRAPCGPQVRARSGPHDSPADRAAHRLRLRDDLSPRRRPRARAGGLGRSGRGGVRAHARVRAPHPHARALPLHVPLPRRGRVGPPIAARHRQGDQRRAALGGDRSVELPARRGGEGAVGRVLRRLSRRQTRAAHAGARVASAASPCPIRSTSVRCSWRGARR